MFTGIVEHMGTVRGVEPRGDGLRAAIDLGPIAEGLRAGDSVAVSGCCLTVVELAGAVAEFDIIPETLARTWFAHRVLPPIPPNMTGAGCPQPWNRWLRPGERVNLERPLRLGGRLDGHIVQGHVDGIAVCSGRGESSDGYRLGFQCADLAPGLVEKGSVAVDGVSLTVTSAGRHGFGVALIPLTLVRTTLGALGPGDHVNIELDVMAKWVRRLAEPYIAAVLRSPPP